MSSDVIRRWLVRRSGCWSALVCAGALSAAAPAVASQRSAGIEPPAAVEAAARGPNEIRVYWDASPGAARYLVVRDGREIGSAAGDQLVYVDTTVEPNRNYRYSVAAVDAAGNRAVKGSYLERSCPVLPREWRCDVLVVGANSAGVSAAVVAARHGFDVVMTEATRRIGGMPANGLGASDLRRLRDSSGFFEEFRRRVKAIYGFGDGLAYEPRVAQQVMKELVWAEPTLTVYREMRPVRVRRVGDRIESVVEQDERTGRLVTFDPRIVVDATDCGDVAAWAGAKFRVGREPRTPREPHAGYIYYDRAADCLLPGSTGRGDKRVQAYAYLMTVKDYGPGADKTIPKPPGYDESEYIHAPKWEHSWAVSSGRLPDHKFEINQHPQGSDLQEVNYRYPIASVKERQRIEELYKNHALGYLYYIQTVEGHRNIGLSDDDYRDTDGWPSSLYVREARRFDGDQRIDETGIEDARALARGNAIGIGDYALDSHAVEPKRHWSRPDMGEGEFYLPQYTPWHQIPYDIMVPSGIDNLFVPTAVSATHVAYGTYRMEAVRMHFGATAGVAAYFCVRFHETPATVPVRQIQQELLKTRAKGETRPAAAGIGQPGPLYCPAYLYLFSDMKPGAPQFADVEYLAARGLFPCPPPKKRTPSSGLECEAFRPNDPATEGDAARVFQWLVARRAAIAPPTGSPPALSAASTRGLTRGTMAVALAAFMGWKATSPADRYADLTPGSPAAEAAEALREQWIDSMLWDGADALLPDGELRFRPDAVLTRAQLAQLAYLAQLHIGSTWGDNPLDKSPQHGAKAWRLTLTPE